MEEKFCVKGINGELLVYDKKVVIRSKKIKGCMYWGIIVGLSIAFAGIPLIIAICYNIFMPGKEKTIYIKNIKSVETCAPNMARNGYIQFNLDDSGNGGISGANENSILIRSKEEYNKAIEVRDYLEDILA